MKDDGNDNKLEDTNEYIYYYEDGKFFREHATTDCFCVGDILVISQVKDDFGVGTILKLSESNHKEVMSCEIHWQKLNTIKWHNLFTLLLLLKQGREVKKTHLSLKGTVSSYIIHQEKINKKED